MLWTEVTSTSPPWQFSTQDPETGTKIQHSSIIFLYVIILPTFLKEHNQPSEPDVTAGHTGVRSFQRTDSGPAGPSRPATSANTANRDPTGRCRQHNHLLKKEGALANPPRPEGSQNRSVPSWTCRYVIQITHILFKPQNCSRQSRCLCSGSTAWDTVTCPSPRTDHTSTKLGKTGKNATH